MNEHDADQPMTDEEILDADWQAYAAWEEALIAEVNARCDARDRDLAGDGQDDPANSELHPY